MSKPRQTRVSSSRPTRVNRPSESKADKPRQSRVNNPLPFQDLSPQHFERLCFWLVGREGYLRPEYYGQSGSDNGRDVTAYKRGEGSEELWYFQCKRTEKITSVDLKLEVDKIDRLVKDDQEKHPAGIVFVTSARASALTRDSVKKYCRRRYRIEFWARAELDERVKRHKDVIAEFFYPAADATHISASRQLPPPFADFTGRERELRELLGDIQGGMVISAMHGMGGVGKTSLAVRVAHELAPAYPGGQLYMNLRGTSNAPATVSEIYGHVIRSYLGPEAKLPEDEGQSRGVYNSVLEGKRVLLLLDNAKNGNQVRPFAPPPNGCLLIITSREYFKLPGLPSPKNLDVMTPDDACKLLLKIAPRIGHEAERIAELCGRLPLAVTAAAVYLANYRYQNVAKYASRLANERTRLEALGAAGFDISFEASFRLSYNSLQAEEAAVFRKLAVFPGPFGAEAAQDVCDDPDNVGLSKLVHLSLVTYDGSRYRLHDLARLFAARKLDDPADGAEERGRALRRYAGHYLGVLRAAQELFSEGGEAIKQGLDLFDVERENILGGQSWAAGNYKAAHEAAQACSDFASHWPILDLRQHPRERIEWLEQAVKAARNLGDRAAEGSHLGALGTAYYRLGECRQSIDYHEQSLAIAREIGNRRAEANALGNLGVVYGALGERPRSYSYYREHLAIARELDDRLGQGYALFNMSLVTEDLDEEAIEHAAEALNILEAIEAPLAKDVRSRLVEMAKGLHNTGYLYDYQGKGKYEIAEPLYRRALAIFERTLGPDHPNAITCRENLRLLYEQQGRASDVPAVAKREYIP